MVDLDAAAVALALSNATLATAVANRIYGGDAPPAGYDPTDGAVCIKSRGGQTRYDPLINCSFQVSATLDGPSTPGRFIDIPTAHAPRGRRFAVAFSQSEVTGQQLTEPTTGRIYILAYFRMEIRP
ncbi:MAG: hypothetical protein H6661_10090 [Ardenticatenaceae bacterium]|nr:hypothetical protein [Ardenticatenaceae bacterium]